LSETGRFPGQTGGIEPRSNPRTPDADAERRRRDAVEINDDVVQGLVVARLAVEVGDLEAAAAALDRTLEAARKIMADLLEAGDPVTPGSLVRTHRPDDRQEGR
jgi:hypothetical protein